MVDLTRRFPWLVPWLPTFCDSGFPGPFLGLSGTPLGPRCSPRGALRATHLRPPWSISGLLVVQIYGPRAPEGL